MKVRSGSLFRCFPGVLIAAVVASVAAPGARSQTPDNQTAYVVTYIEVTPSAEAAAATLLRRVAATSRKEAGNLRYDILHGAPSSPPWKPGATGRRSRPMAAAPP
jgi:hypothetical protein